MCGIMGFAYQSEQKVEPSFLEKLLQQQSYRGPDDKGFLLFSNTNMQLGDFTDQAVDAFPAQVGLFHRRLSIIDLSQQGWQPMTTGDNRYYIIFNGEIYNYIELRAELKELGHEFHSASDTEVLLAAFIHWGDKMLSRLIGMFAFAIFDTQKRQIFIARDFFGIKPLFYAVTSKGFVFASELKTLLEFSEISREINPQVVFDYLNNGITEHTSETMFSQIKKLAPSHCLTIDIDLPHHVKPIRYYEFGKDPIQDITFEEAVTQVRELFLENVRLHLRSDVQVGAALSGGIDSSAIVMAMRYLMGADLDLHTFTYLAPGETYNEEAWSRIIVEEANTTAHNVYADSESLISDMKHLVRMQDEPFGGTSIYAQYRIFKAAKEAGIKVMLDGQGADELLGGYEHYNTPYFASLIRRGQFGDALKFYNNLQSSDLHQDKLIRITLGFFLPQSFIKHQHVKSLKNGRLPWLNAEWFTERDVSYSRAAMRDIQGTHFLRSAMYNSLTQVGLPDLLRYEDRNSMAHSIESRVPFLTPNLADFLLSLPEEYLIASDTTRKLVFREAMRGIVPDKILDRKDKIGFQTPEFKWLEVSSQWFNTLISGDYAREIPVFNHPEVNKIWNNMLENPSSFNARIVWRWINLIEWSKSFEGDYI